MAESGQSVFWEPTNIFYGSQQIFGVESINLSSDITLLLAYDNGFIRPTASQVVKEVDTFNMMFTDLAGYIACRALVSGVPANLTFKWLPFTQNIATGTLPAQLVTFNNVVLETNTIGAPTKATGKFSIKGQILAISDGDDPVTFATWS